MLRQGDLMAAADCYHQAISALMQSGPIEPTAVAAHYGLGLTLFQQEQWAAAADCYRRAITQSQNSAQQAIAYSNLGCALVQQGQFTAAIASFEQGIRLAPRWATLYVNLGHALPQVGRVAEAIAACDQAIHLDPTAVFAHRQRAHLLQTQANWTQAIASWQRVIELTPDDIAAWGELAIAQMAQGEWIQAMTNLRAALTHQPVFAQAFCHKASKLSGDDAWTQAQISCAHLLDSLRSTDTTASLQRLAETYLHRANLLWQYGGTAQLQQGDRDYEIALRIANQNLRLAIAVQRPKTNQATPPAGIHTSTAAWAASALPGQTKYLALSTPPAATTKMPSGVYEAETACAGLNCVPCLQQIHRWFTPLHLGQGTYACGRSVESEPDGSLPLFVTTILQGRAWAVPQTNAWMICNAIAVLTPDDQLLADLARDYPGQLPGCRHSSPQQHRIFSTARPPLEPIAGTVAALTGLSGHIYFHWLTDVLPRLALLQQSGYDWQAIDHFWLNGAALPFQQETLAALGIPQEKVLSSDRHPHIQAEVLVAPSFAGHLGWMQPWALGFLRQVFLPLGDRVPGSHARTRWPSRIYISRRCARYRRVINEDAVIDLLRPAGFVPVLLESLSFAEQVALFAQAEAIVAPHGSGLANLAFCRPQTTMIELFAPDYVRPYYWIISQHLRLRHYYALGEEFACRPLQTLMHPNPLTADILVNLDALKKLMKRAEVIE